MAYQALYRKWRPLTFDDVVGQEHITKTLKNELMNGRVAHAYLFCGTRGTGKTSTAKIFARAINCPHSVDGNPCNQCEVCRGILDESILDVVEMDAASNTGVEDIRRIIEDAMFLPSTAQKKVYIIDEVHMISTSAFNALLKTLEEPPEHVVFILATTEYHKLPATVLSRCQRFDFRRITAEDIAARLRTILDGEGLMVEEEGVRLVAELGDGSMRDALSVLDGCLAYTDGTLTAEDIIKIIGIADDDALYDIAEAIGTGDACRAIASLNGVLAAGRDLRAFVESLVKYLRDILIVKLTTDPSGILNRSQQRMEQLGTLAQKLTQERLTYALDQLNNAVIQAKGSVYSATVFELALIKTCDSTMADSREALLDRLRVLEQKIEQGVPVRPAPANAPAEAAAQPPAKSAPTPEAVKAEPALKPKGRQPAAQQTNTVPAGSTPTPEVQAAMDKWDEIKLHLRGNGGLPICSHLSGVTLKAIRGQLGIVFPNERAMNKNLVNRPGSLELIAASVKAITGQELAVKCYLQKEIGEEATEQPASADGLDALKQAFPELEIIDE